jgi:hypothetical protein
LLGVGGARPVLAAASGHTGQGTNRNDDNSVSIVISLAGSAEAIWKLAAAMTEVDLQAFALEMAG